VPNWFCLAGDLGHGYLAILAALAAEPEHLKTRNARGNTRWNGGYEASNPAPLRQAFFVKVDARCFERYKKPSLLSLGVAFAASIWDVTVALSHLAHTGVPL